MVALHARTADAAAFSFGESLANWAPASWKGTSSVEGSDTEGATATRRREPGPAELEPDAKHAWSASPSGESRCRQPDIDGLGCIKR
jgi:hypothetical protein